METILTIERTILPAQEGTYFSIPFPMPEDSASITLTYRYARHRQEEHEVGSGLFTAREEINIIDLGLIDPSGKQVGASGSDKNEVFVSETQATPGYRPTLLTKGEWQILVGAYKIVPEGVRVIYEVRIVPKRGRWFKGDLHAHTLASDGVHTLPELASKAARHGLDFLAITDHNQAISAVELPQVDGLTLIPGLEWTHYKGHANFLGVDRPFDGSFAANTPEEIRALFLTAHERGATITLNHPFEEDCGFQLDYNNLPIDCLEVWNGPMRESNLRAIGLWHSLLAAGKKIPLCGGSDYHRDTPFIFLGGPTNYVYAQSAGPGEILAALRAGHSYITFAPNGPSLELSAGEEAILGDTVSWTTKSYMDIQVDGLQRGDVVRAVTASGSAVLLEAPAPGKFKTRFELDTPGFARVEVLRAFLPGIPRLPALISNPIYFE